MSKRYNEGIDKKVIRTNYITSAYYLAIFYIGGFVMGKLFIRDYKTLDIKFMLLAAFCFTVLGLATIYQIIHIRCYKLRLEGEILTIRYWIDGLYPRGEFSFPVWNECDIHIKDIQYIMLNHVNITKNMLLELDASFDASRLRVSGQSDDTDKVLCIVEASGAVHIINAAFYSSKALESFVQLMLSKNKDINLVKIA